MDNSCNMEMVDGDNSEPTISHLIRAISGNSKHCGSCIELVPCGQNNAAVDNVRWTSYTKWTSSTPTAYKSVHLQSVSSALNVASSKWSKMVQMWRTLIPCRNVS